MSWLRCAGTLRLAARLAASRTQPWPAERSPWTTHSKPHRAKSPARLTCDPSHIAVNHTKVCTWPECSPGFPVRRTLPRSALLTAQTHCGLSREPCCRARGHVPAPPTRLATGRPLSPGSLPAARVTGCCIDSWRFVLSLRALCAGNDVGGAAGEAVRVQMLCEQCRPMVTRNAARPNADAVQSISERRANPSGACAWLSATAPCCWRAGLSGPRPRQIKALATPLCAGLCDRQSCASTMHFAVPGPEVRCSEQTAAGHIRSDFLASLLKRKARLYRGNAARSHRCSLFVMRVCVCLLVQCAELTGHCDCAAIRACRRASPRHR